MAYVSTGFILWIYPEHIGIGQNDMFRSAVDTLSPLGNESLHANLTCFINIGYLEISKNQNVDNIVRNSTFATQFQTISLRIDQSTRW